MLNNRLELLSDYAFTKLNNLLAPISPRANLPPVIMSVGDPQHAPPAFVHEIIAGNPDAWNRYPPVNGTPEFRAAAAGWLGRRYRLPKGFVDPERQIAPCAGTREGLFLAALLAVTPADNGGPKPFALMPNPFYQVYYGAAVMAGAEPRFLAAGKATGFMPDLGAIDAATLARTRLMYLCTPGNPQGAIATLDYLCDAIKLARRHDFLLVVDECYAEIYNTAPPPGALEAAASLGGSLDNILALHSLSKRSSAAGLRSGFCVGTPQTIARLWQLRSYSCAATPVPLLEAATALWNDDDHVAPIRRSYQEKFALAERLLDKQHGYYTPEAGLFLWLEVGDGEAATKKLWAEAAIKVLPGAYITRPDLEGRNLGTPYIRVALVHDREITETALTRLARIL
jgi:aspartate/methionine/tyrosine aminotransferase